MSRFVFFGFFFLFCLSFVSSTVSVVDFVFVIPSEFSPPPSGGGGGGSVFPPVGNCSSGLVFNGSSCVDSSMVSWRVVDDLVSGKVFLSLNPVKRVSFQYFFDSVPFDPLVVEGFLLVDGVSLPVFLLHEDVGVFVFDYDFSGFPDGVYDLVIFFDGHPYQLSLDVVSSNPVFSSVLFGVDFFDGVGNGSRSISVVVWVVLVSLVVVVVLLFFLFRKGKSEDLVVGDVL